MTPKFHRTLDTPRQKKFSRIAVIGSITMLQGALYLVLSIWALLIFACQFDMTSTNIGTIMYFIYFRNRDCAEVRWSKSQADVADLPKVTFVAERTEGLIISYVAISFLWILTSFFVVVGATRTKLNRTSFHCYFTPWAIVIIAGCLLDIIATAFFIYDICHTATAESTFQFLDVRNIWEIINNAEANYKHFSYPSIILTCASSRLVVLFLFNFFGMLWAIKQAAKLILNRDDQLEYSGHETPQPPVEQSRIPPLDPNQYYYVPTRAPAESFPQLSDPYRRTFEPLKAGNDLNSQIAPPDYYNPGERKSKRTQSSQHMPTNVSGQVDVVVQRRRKSSSKSPIVENKYPSGGGGGGGGRQQQQQQQPINDILRVQSDRYPVATPLRNSDRFSAPQPERSSMVTGELRSQLPWSYFNAREDMTSPKKTLAHAEEDHEILPPVPVPDYTLHFPRKDRYTIQDRVAQLQASSGYSSSTTSNQNGGNRW